MEDTALPLNPRDYLILFSLTVGPRHGYGLLKDIAELTGDEVRFDPANLYRTLRRMMKDGLVAEVDHPGNGEPDNQRRNYFALTDAGTKAVRAETVRLDRLTRVARARNMIPDPESPA